MTSPGDYTARNLVSTSLGHIRRRFLHQLERHVYQGSIEPKHSETRSITMTETTAAPGEPHVACAAPLDSETGSRLSHSAIKVDGQSCPSWQPTGHEPLSTHTFRSPTEMPSGHPDWHLVKKQTGASVWLVEDEYICKEGFRVFEAEYMAMEIAMKHQVPVPEPMHFRRGRSGGGEIHMEFIQGVTLDEVWPKLSPQNKRSLCRHTWEIVVNHIRTAARPSDLPRHGACAVDGSSPADPLLHSGPDGPKLLNDADVRLQIASVYAANHGTKHTQKEVMEKLPSSDRFYFTHADLAPRNIMVKRDESHHYHIVAIIDWERAGFYPSYWEYINVCRKPQKGQEDWRDIMQATAPDAVKCDLEMIKAVRHVVL